MKCAFCGIEWVPAGLPTPLCTSTDPLVFGLPHCPTSPCPEVPRTRSRPAAYHHILIHVRRSARAIAIVERQSPDYLRDVRDVRMLRA